MFVVNTSAPTLQTPVNICNTSWDELCINTGEFTESLTGQAETQPGVPVDSHWSVQYGSEAVVWYGCSPASSVTMKVGPLAAGLSPYFSTEARSHEPTVLMRSGGGGGGRSGQAARLTASLKSLQWTGRSLVVEEGHRIQIYSLYVLNFIRTFEVYTQFQVTFRKPVSIFSNWSVQVIIVTTGTSAATKSKQWKEHFLWRTCQRQEPLKNCTGTACSFLAGTTLAVTSCDCT